MADQQSEWITTPGAAMPDTPLRVRGGYVKFHIGDVGVVSYPDDRTDPPDQRYPFNGKRGTVMAFTRNGLTVKLRIEGHAPLIVPAGNVVRWKRGGSR